MKTGGRIAAALFVSTLAHGALLLSMTAKPNLQPEPITAGKLSVSLQRSSTEGRTAADGEPVPTAKPAEVKTSEPARATERQTVATADSKYSSSPANEPAARDLAQAKPATESSAATSVNPAQQNRAVAKPTRTASAKPPAQPLPPLRTNENRDTATDSEKTTAPQTQASGPPETEAPVVTPGARKAVQASLEDELARHFHYPFLARRRGWEGKVVLRLRIDRRGHIDSTEVAESSGHGILDRAALEAVAKVALIPGAAERLGGLGLYLELPVIYRLSEG
jgi:protein TonB